MDKPSSLEISFNSCLGISTDMKLTLRYFASIREGLSISTEEWETKARTLNELRAELCSRGEVFAQHLCSQQPVRMAMNQSMSIGTEELVEHAEVAFFPPVTGG